jgi:hypothetical protein
MFKSLAWLGIAIFFLSVASSRAQSSLICFTGQAQTNGIASISQVAGCGACRRYRSSSVILFECMVSSYVCAASDEICCRSDSCNCPSCTATPTPTPKPNSGGSSSKSSGKKLTIGGIIGIFIAIIVVLVVGYQVYANQNCSKQEPVAVATMRGGEGPIQDTHADLARSKIGLDRSYMSSQPTHTVVSVQPISVPTYDPSESLTFVPASQTGVEFAQYRPPRSAISRL